MVDGSATNWEMETFGGGGGFGTSAGGGGGGGGATFFLHPVAARNIVNPNRTMLIFRIVIIDLIYLKYFQMYSMNNRHFHTGLWFWPCVVSFCT